MSDFLSLMDMIFEQKEQNGVFNVSTGEGHSIKELYQVVADYLSLDAPEVPVVPAGADDVPKVVLDPSNTSEIFGWKARISFRDTIYKQLEWYDKYGISDVFSHLKQS
jgi:nucleoside-diphosphate-sugar epimerase